MRRDIVAMLFWALRWHEGRRISHRVLIEVLWGGFASKPKDPVGSLREMMAWVEKRHGAQWIIEHCQGKAFRISPRHSALKASRRVSSGSSPVRQAPPSCLSGRRAAPPRTAFQTDRTRPSKSAALAGAPKAEERGGRIDSPRLGRGLPPGPAPELQSSGVIR
jgi:hypothetical protein